MSTPGRALLPPPLPQLLPLRALGHGPSSAGGGTGRDSIDCVRHLRRGVYGQPSCPISAGADCWQPHPSGCRRLEPMGELSRLPLAWALMLMITLSSPLSDGTCANALGFDVCVPVSLRCPSLPPCRAAPLRPRSYPYFLSQMSTFVYLPIFFGIVLYEFKFTNFITPEMTAFPKRK